MHFTDLHYSNTQSKTAKVTMADSHSQNAGLIPYILGKCISKVDCLVGYTTEICAACFQSLKNSLCTLTAVARLRNANAL